MLSGLIVTAFLMGVGGIAHCAAMCGAPCAAVLPRGVPVLALCGRCVVYATLGLVASSSTGLLARWGQQVSMLQPLWLMLQLAAVLLGLWLLVTGRMPEQANVAGRELYMRLRQHAVSRRQLGSAGQTARWLPFFAGLAWGAMPCGLLYAALMVAALASEPWGGGLVMLAFAIPSATGVWAAPRLLKWFAHFRKRPAQLVNNPTQQVPILWFKDAPGCESTKTSAVCESSQASQAFDPRWAVRLAGLSLALTAAWAVSHQVMAQWRAWCA